VERGARSLSIRRSLALALILATGALSACGGDDEPAPTATTGTTAVASVTADGVAVPEAVLRTAEAIHAAAASQDLAALGAIAAEADDFQYSFGEAPGGDPVAFWAGDGTGGEATSGSMVDVLERSVATDGSYWWWPAAFVTEQYVGLRIGIDDAGVWRYCVAGD